MSSLVDRKTLLEDSSGQRWKVTLSNHEGSLAFQEGWHSFCHDHGLEVGDFLAFYYIRGSHFIVHIWGTSGCEKLNNYGEHGHRKKKIKTKRNSAAQDGQCHMTDKNLTNKQGSSTSVEMGSNTETRQGQPIAIDNTSNFNSGNERLQLVSTTEYREEPFYMINRDVGCHQEEDRTCLYDLSKFEMQRSRSVADGTNKVPGGDETCPHHADTMLKSQTDAGLVDEDLGDIRITSQVAPPDAADGTVIEKTNDPGLSDFSSRSVSISILKSHSGEMRKEIQPEQVKKLEEFGGCGRFLHSQVCGQSSSSALKDNDKVDASVKTEPVDSFDLSLPDDDDTSCLAVMNSEDVVELPSQLPSISFRRMKHESRVVFLRDPDRRLWPVLYCQKYGLKILTSGWKAFSKANNIQPGDECVFVLESKPECIYKVDIVRK
ncbi:unnamed protein product [Ilex paraguariensis]|uniref:TF-B3 domain-containing protein n=1 Tax=Ilex paraguariensis TaxID=185542 RepID=A0ABC8RFS3_9AQUA